MPEGGSGGGRGILASLQTMGVFSVWVKLGG